MKKTIALLFFVFLFGGLIIYRWHEKETAGSGAPAPEVLPVETVFLKKLTFEDKVSFAAGIEPEEKAAVVCKVPGKTVLRVFVSEGDSVKEGDPLAIVDDSLLRQQILQAEAALGRASSYASTVAADFGRISGLYKEEVVSRQQYDRAQGEARMAARQVQEARAAGAQRSSRRLQSSRPPEAEPMATMPAPLMATTVSPMRAALACSPNHRAPT